MAANPFKSPWNYGSAPDTVRVGYGDADLPCSLCAKFPFKDGGYINERKMCTECFSDLVVSGPPGQNQDKRTAASLLQLLKDHHHRQVLEHLIVASQKHTVAIESLLTRATAAFDREEDNKKLKAHALSMVETEVFSHAAELREIDKRLLRLESWFMQLEDLNGALVRVTGRHTA